MNRLTKTITKTVSALSDPDPTFVSIVRRGANQRPFKVVKSDQLPETMKKNANAEKVEKGVTPEVDIHKIVFTGENFAKKADVQKYMDAEGYSNFTITKLDDDFVVQAIAEEEFEAIQPIKKEEGVVMFVGKLTADAKARKAAVIVNVNTEAPAAAAKPAATEEAPPAAAAAPAAKEEAPAAAAAPAAKADEVRTRTRSDSFLTVKNDKLLARKIDSYCSYYGCGSTCSNEITIAAVLEDMKDGLPVGFYDVYSAFVAALKNIVLTNNIDQISVLMAEFGSIITKLATLTASVEKADREEAFKTLMAVPEGTKVAKGDATPGEAFVGEFEGFEAQLQKALEPVMTQLGLLATKEEVKPLQDTVQKLSARVLNQEAIRQERKGADADDLEGVEAHEEEPAVKTAKEDKAKDEAALKKGEQNLFGTR